MTLPARVAALLGTITCSLSLLSAVAAAAPSAQPSNKRQVVIGIVNPPPGPTIRLTTREGEAASFKKSDLGSFKFVPTVESGDKTVLLKVVDADSDKQIDRLHLTVGGKPMQPKGLPFQLEIISVTVTAPK